MDDLELFKQPKQVIVQELTIPIARLIAIGDTHGCIHELNELLSTINITGYDTLIMLGDLVDRGPDPEAVVQKIQELCKLGNVFCVQGNHDNKHVRYARHELLKVNNATYKNPMKPNEEFLSIHTKLSIDSLRFLASLPHAVVICDVFDNSHRPLYLFTHAGVTPGLFKQDPQAFIRNRYLTNKNGHLVPTKTIKIGDTWYVPEGALPWTHYYDYPFTTVYGHAVQNKPLVINNTIGIDTGCCFGGELTAIIINQGKYEFCCVVAKKMYNSNHG